MGRKTFLSALDQQILADARARFDLAREMIGHVADDSLIADLETPEGVARVNTGGQLAFAAEGTTILAAVMVKAAATMRTFESLHGCANDDLFVSPGIYRANRIAAAADLSSRLGGLKVRS